MKKSIILAAAATLACLASCTDYDRPGGEGEALMPRTSWQDTRNNSTMQETTESMTC